MSDEAKQGSVEGEATGNPAQPTQAPGAAKKDERSWLAEEREKTKRAEHDAEPGLGFSVKGGPGAGQQED
jgi:hypothetical protein